MTAEGEGRGTNWNAEWGEPPEEWEMARVETLPFYKLPGPSITKLLSVFQMFCAIESMFGMVLKEPLGRALLSMDQKRIVQISEGISDGTRAWLKNGRIIDLARAEKPSAPSVSLAAHEWKDAWGKEPNDSMQSFAKRSFDQTSFWGRTYSRTAWEAFRAEVGESNGESLKSLWHENPDLAGMILRSAKFHGETEKLLRSLTDAHIAFILDTQLSRFSEFKGPLAPRFMEIDGCSLMKIVALFPAERTANILNLISVETRAAIFNQGYHMAANERTYVCRLLSRELFLLNEFAQKLAQILAPVLLASGIKDMKGVKDGSTVAKIVIVDASLRAQDWGIPLAQMPAASRLLKGFNGKWVALEVKDGVASLRRATEDEVQSARAGHGLISVGQIIKDKANIIVDHADILQGPGRVGRKTYNLARLAEIVDVPPFVGGTAGAVHRYYKANGLYKRIPGILSGKEPLNKRLMEIRKLISKGVMPKGMLPDFAGVDLGTETIIVRSSNLLEDLPQFMAAGIYHSPVGKKSEMGDLLRGAWASYWSEAAYAGREKFGIDHMSQLPAVAVQAFIKGEISGTMIVGKNRVIINAVPGLNEGFTSGKVAPNVYEYVNSAGVIEQKSAVHSLKVPVDALAKLGQKIYGIEDSEHIDVEYTIANGRIFILQSRPYTGTIR